jgi:hypothetical protein
MNTKRATQQARAAGFSYVITLAGKIHLDDFLAITSHQKLTFEAGKLISPWLPSILHPGNFERLVFELQ